MRVRNSFSVRAATGVLGATLAAGATVFAMRNGTTKTVYITRIQASFAATVAFTAASQQLWVAERFTAATPSGGTAYTPARHRAAGPASAIADARAATTGALTVTSVVFEGNQIPLLGTASPAVSTTHNGEVIDFSNDPIVLAVNEGLAIRNVVVWPAAGTGPLTALVSWYEK
jgi:hypothetical protein